MKALLKEPRTYQIPFNELSAEEKKMVQEWKETHDGQELAFAMTCEEYIKRRKGPLNREQRRKLKYKR